MWIPGYDGPREAGYSCEVRAVVDKEDPESAEVQRWINLVDSELWAIRRVLGREMPDGRRADEHFKDWVAAGRPDVPVLTQQLWDGVLARTPAIESYFERVLKPLQVAGRSAHLHEEPWGDSGEP